MANTYGMLEISMFRVYNLAICICEKYKVRENKTNLRL